MAGPAFDPRGGEFLTGWDTIAGALRDTPEGRGGSGSLRMGSVAFFGAACFIGLPQWMQAWAESEMSFPQSGHWIRAMVPDFCRRAAGL